MTIKTFKGNKIAEKIYKKLEKSDEKGWKPLQKLV